MALLVLVGKLSNNHQFPQLFGEHIYPAKNTLYEAKRAFSKSAVVLHKTFAGFDQSLRGFHVKSAQVLYHFCPSHDKLLSDVDPEASLK